MEHIIKVTDLLLKKYPDAKIIYAVSLIVDNHCGQRVFSKIKNAYSDKSVYYQSKSLGNPMLLDIFYDQIIKPNTIIASHGLFHVDHRLLGFDAQEMSILGSCSLLESNTFVPPFNKWNETTELVCNKHGIELIKFEEGWQCMEYEEYNPNTKLWYLHAREMTIEQVKEWLDIKHKFTLNEIVSKGWERGSFYPAGSGSGHEYFYVKNKKTIRVNENSLEIRTYDGSPSFLIDTIEKLDDYGS